MLTIFIAGSAAADIPASVFSFSGPMSTSTSVSVEGTVNETVSFTKTTIGSREKTVLTDTFTTVNPSGLSWHSHITLNGDPERVWVDYTRTGGVPWISWRQLFSR
jgi:hypothetical protein